MFFNTLLLVCRNVYNFYMLNLCLANLRNFIINSNNKMSLDFLSKFQMQESHYYYCK